MKRRGSGGTRLERKKYDSRMLCWAQAQRGKKMDKPDIGAIVYHKASGMKAQVCQHYSDAEHIVQVILFPQPGAFGNDRYKKWSVDDCVQAPNAKLISTEEREARMEEWAARIRRIELALEAKHSELAEREARLRIRDGAAGSLDLVAEERQYRQLRNQSNKLLRAAESINKLSAAAYQKANMALAALERRKHNGS
jgi:hypothetical protein